MSSRLSPSGFVIVPADDLVEPILGFTNGQAYEPTAQNPLTALITADLDQRLTDALPPRALGRLQIQSVTDTQTRWSDLISKAGSTPGDLGILSLPTVSDVRVAPFLKTQLGPG